MPHMSTLSAQTFEVHGVTFRSYASSAAGAAQLGAWCAEFGPRTIGVPHRMSHEEVLYVLEGRLDVEIDGEQFIATAGDCVLVPAGARFRIDNDTDAAARAWATTTLGMTATIEPTGDHMAPPWAQ